MMPNGAPRDPSVDATAPTVNRHTELNRYSLGAWGRLRAILEGAPPQPVELCNGLQLLLWSIWLLVFDTTPIVYRSMRFASQHVWGALGLGLCVFALGALLLDGRRTRSISALLCFSLWLFLALLIGASTGFSSTEVPIQIARAVMMGWVYVRLERGRAH